jgi:serine/threonine protein phosphatase PrpC
MMQYSFYALTDAGQVRVNNEDAFAFNEEFGIAVLADGMGGYNAGEVASGMAVAFVKSELTHWLSVDQQSSSPAQIALGIRLCVDRANQSILNAAMANPQYLGMGTTVVAGVFKQNCLVLGHVGDSRCYRWRAASLTQITRDHSLLQERVDAGLLTPAQAATAPGKNLLTRALGVEDGVQVELHEHEVLDGDLYLMCSDGLTDMLDDSKIAAAMGARALLPEIAVELVARANAAGGRDNIAVLLVRASASVSKPGLMSRLFG